MLEYNIIKQSLLDEFITEDHILVYNYFAKWVGLSSVLGVVDFKNKVDRGEIPFYDIPIRYWEGYNLEEKRVIDYSYLIRFGRYALKCFEGVLSQEIYHFSRKETPAYQVKYTQDSYPTPLEYYTLSDISEYKWCVDRNKIIQMNGILVNYSDLPLEFQQDLATYPNKHNIITYSRKINGSRIVVSQLTKIPFWFRIA